MASFVHIPLVPLAVYSATANGSSFTMSIPGWASFVLAATADVTGTTLDCDIEAYDPTSATWNVIDSFTQIGGTTPSRERIILDGIPERIIRAAFTIVGTSYTFSVSASGWQA